MTIRKFFYKPFEKDISEQALTFEEIKKISDEKTQIFDLKTGWYWFADFEQKVKNNIIKV